MWPSAAKVSGVSTVSFRQPTDNSSTPVLTKFYERLVDSGPKEYTGSSAGLGLQPSHLTCKQTTRPVDPPASAVQQAYAKWSRNTEVATAALLRDALEVIPLDLVSILSAHSRPAGHQLVLVVPYWCNLIQYPSQQRDTGGKRSMYHQAAHPAVDSWCHAEGAFF
jgi:hypothetical protein